ncbi:MAG: hypothetical protein M3421_13610, partial [Bacteroidota bacterium]|nr:hypothetical protein [Bacteroidota bacterium]
MTSYKILKLKRIRLISRFLLLVILFQVFQFPAYALTSGPTQPEVQSFEPVGTTDMVDLFSGDFNYNIPLFELPGPNGGYPFNLSYHAGIGMDQEASWTGLGWNLNPGAITRQMRGLPDEFNGDLISTKMSIDPNITVGVGAGTNVEIFGENYLSYGLGLSVYNNNYKGIGYNIDASLGFGTATKAGNLGMGLGLSLDNKEGVGVNPSIGLSGRFGNSGIGANYNSQTGLSNISLSYSKSVTYSKKHPVFRSTNMGGSSNISLAHPGYTPQISMPMINMNIAATFQPGGAWWGMFGSPYVNGFYNEQSLVNDKKWISVGAIGYMNYQYGTDKSIMDFNRDKDGIVSKEFPNLAIPSLTYDIYSVTGQGLSAMYRPIRNDTGFVYDPETKSTSVGGSLGADAGPTMVHVGVNLGVKHARSLSGKWTDHNEIEENFKFQEKKHDDLFEPWYFKVHGEPSIEEANLFEAIGGYDPVNVKLTGGRENPTASKIIERNKIQHPAPDNASFNRERKSRNQAIIPITNEQLLSNGQDVENLFKIRYINAQGNESSFSRGSLPKHHIAGYTALTPDGLRYNYALPAYNISQEEVVFSAKKLNGPVVKAEVKDGEYGDPFYEQHNSDKYLKRTHIPQYAHSYLLTSIVGPDYVDVTGNGVTSDDLGYWVKFTYQNITTPNDRYQWRDPFSHAHFVEGFKTDTRDDKGTFTYGTKELWYLSKAETKSHIAKFIT